MRRLLAKLIAMIIGVLVLALSALFALLQTG
jgi:hypothetical protein